MKLSFGIKDGKSWTLEGKLLDYAFAISPREVTTITLRIALEQNTVVLGDEKTPIIKLPDSADSAVRVGGARSFKIEFGKIAVVEFNVIGIYSQYEHAAAAEMQFQMEKTRYDEPPF